jgi:hypothetical protein
MRSDLGASGLGKAPQPPLPAAAEGRRRILGWALLAASAAALAANLNTLLTLFGAPPAAGGEDQVQALLFLGRTAPAFVFAGAGLALAATVEMRRATTGMQAPGRGERALLKIAWLLLGLAVLGAVSPTGIP